MRKARETEEQREKDRILSMKSKSAARKNANYKIKESIKRLLGKEKM